MFNNKGMTLIESLFAFEIFIVVIVMLVSLFQLSLSQEIRLNEYYQTINQKEESITHCENFEEIVKQVLH